MNYMPLIYFMYAMLFVVLVIFGVKYFLQKWIARQEIGAAALFSNENEVIRVLVNRLEVGSPYRSYAEMLLQAYSEHARVSTQVDLSDWLATASGSAKKIQEPHLTTEHTCFYILAVFSAGLGLLLGGFEISNSFFKGTVVTSVNLVQISNGVKLVLFGIGISMLCMMFGAYLGFKNKRNLINFERFTLASLKMFLQTAEEIGYQSPKQLTQIRQIIQPLLSQQK